MLPVRRWPGAAATLARTFGVRGTTFRTAYELRRALHAFRSAPREAIALDRVRANTTFRVDADRLRAATDPHEARTRAEHVLAGRYPAYRWTWQPLPRDAQGWRTHPSSGHVHTDAAPWWTVAHLSSASGDIKDLWEPARFGWVYDLVRASVLFDEPSYVTAFTEHFERWRASSPAFRGPHWSCGQETAIRAVALLYAEANLPLSPATRADVLHTLAASGERIDDAFGYAVSQRNNHALSEAVGLLAIGARLAGAHPAAARWYARGRRWLARLIEEQFADDGWYVQHSFTYLRLALDQCVIGARVLRAHGEHLPEAAVRRLHAATDLVFAVLDVASGDVPNHGANDGAFVHPITTATYRDFRSVLTATCASFGIAWPTNVRRDGEVLAWLDLAVPGDAPPLGDGVWSGRSGWAAARVGAMQVFLRAGEYASRPSHIDPLQLDVRAAGTSLVVDAGTFAYNGTPPWRNGLVAARMHNGPILDGVEPGIRGPRFLWYAWPDAAIVSADRAGDEVTIVAERDGALRRTVHVTAEYVRVEDRALAGRGTRLEVRWLLHPEARADVLEIDVVPDAPDVVAAHVTTLLADEASADGWYSPGYGVRVPSRVRVASTDARAGATIVTTIAPPRTQVVRDVVSAELTESLFPA